LEGPGALAWRLALRVGIMLLQQKFKVVSTHSSSRARFPPMPRDLISAKTRQEFREYFVATTLAKIDDAFRAEGFEADLSHEPSVGGQRRSLVEQYYHTVDWRNAEQVAGILRVFEGVLVALDLEAAGNGYNTDWARETAVALRRWLARERRAVGPLTENSP